MQVTSSRRTDDQLLGMMDEPTDWTINGRGGVSLGSLHNLREALCAVFGYEALKWPVFAVCAQPGDAIIIFREQVARIAEAGQVTLRGVLQNDIRVSPGHGALAGNQFAPRGLE